MDMSATAAGIALVVGEEGGNRLLHGADAAGLQARDALQGIAEVPPLSAGDAQQRRVLPHLVSQQIMCIEQRYAHGI